MIYEKLQKEADATSAVSSVKLLLDADASKEQAILESAFPKSSLSAKIRLGRFLSKKLSVSEEYGMPVFTADEIKAVCMKYRLRFLSSKKYKGEVPQTTLHKLRTLAETKKKLAYSIDAGNEFYVMAPAGMFNLTDITDEKMMRMKEIRRDPALFIRLGDGLYGYICEWGNSFSIWRRVLGALTAKIRTLNILFFIAWLMAVSLSVYSCFEIVDWINSLNKKMQGICVFMFMAYAVFLAVILISWALSASKGFFLGRIKEQHESWWRLDEDIATDSNWSSEKVITLF